MKNFECNGKNFCLQTNGKNFTIEAIDNNARLKKVIFHDNQATAIWHDNSETTSVGGVLKSVEDWGMSFISARGEFWPCGIMTGCQKIIF